MKHNRIVKVLIKANPMYELVFSFTEDGKIVVKTRLEEDEVQQNEETRNLLLPKSGTLLYRVQTYKKNGGKISRIILKGKEGCSLNISYGDNEEIIVEALQSDILSEHIIFGKNFSPNFLVPPYRIQMKRKGCDLTLSTYE